MIGANQNLDNFAVVVLFSLPIGNVFRSIVFIAKRRRTQSALLRGGFGAIVAEMSRTQPFARRQRIP